MKVHYKVLSFLTLISITQIVKRTIGCCQLSHLEIN
ncbi:hypothetical protein FORC085_2058 [Bacillus cereus]|nr:hypothetical protein FORC085_2058 [Bacillus cereus]